MTPKNSSIFHYRPANFWLVVKILSILLPGTLKCYFPDILPGVESLVIDTDLATRFYYKAGRKNCLRRTYTDQTG